MMMRTALLCACVAACGTTRPSSLGGGSDGSGSDDTGSGNAGAVALPQAIGGAMFVDPVAFPTIPVHVQTTGPAGHVAVALDGASTDAVPDAGSTTAWTATVDVHALADGPHALVATADGATATATLVAGAQDAQLTDIATDGNAGTPRLHRAGDHLYLTWTDAETGPRIAWLQELDGAGRPIGDRVALAGGAGQPDVLYARTALGASSVAVLYQQTGGPYTNYVTIVGLDGTPHLAAMPLDGTRYGSAGGDVVYDGASGFDVTWRTNDGMGGSEVDWMHVDEASGAVTGPLVAASPGHDDPHGGFDPIIDVTVQHAGDASLVAFLRYEYDQTLAEEVDRCNVVTIRGGAVASTDLAGIGGGFFWDDDCRVLAGPVAVWARKDLTSSADNPPDVLVGADAPGGALAPARGNGATMVDAPESREQPFLVPTGAASILAWTDARAYANSTSGQVQLYAARVAADLSTSATVAFASSHVIEGTADVHGAPAGTNAIVTWIDERHGGTIVSPMPEVYLETVWQ
jgi:hypothetical protein